MSVEQSAEIARAIEWREQIGVAALLATTCTHDGDEFGPSAVCETCFGNVQTALRSLIADPKPAEPMGLGAVVEDADGKRWLRSGSESWWRVDMMAASDWSGIAAVKVLSEGVTQ